jgi:hypothetical protein
MTFSNVWNGLSRFARPFPLIYFFFSHSSTATTVTVILSNVRTSSSVEFKVKSGYAGVRTTGPVQSGIPTTKWNWDIGDQDLRLQVWWNALDGRAHLTLLIDGVTVFMGYCGGRGTTNETPMHLLCTNPEIYKMSGPGPRIFDEDDFTYVIMPPYR